MELGLEHVHSQMGWDVHLPVNRRTFPEPSRQKGTSKLLQLPRYKISLVLQVLTGHGNFGSHLKLTGRWNDTCKKCHLGVESREHIVEIYPAYYRLRQEVLLSNIGSLHHLVSTQRFNR